MNRNSPRVISFQDMVKKFQKNTKFYYFRLIFQQEKDEHMFPLRHFTAFTQHTILGIFWCFSLRNGYKVTIL